MKALNNPPADVGLTLAAVMTCLDRQTDWASARKMMADSNNFLNMLKNYDKDNVSAKTLKKLEVYYNNPAFTPDNVKAKSAACA